MTILNFLLNTFSSVLNHATAQPNVADLHALIDRAAAHQNHSPQQNQGAPTHRQPQAAPQQTQNVRQLSQPSQPQVSLQQNQNAHSCPEPCPPSHPMPTSSSFNVCLEEQDDKRTNSQNIEFVLKISGIRSALILTRKKRNQIMILTRQRRNQIMTIRNLKISNMRTMNLKTKLLLQIRKTEVVRLGLLKNQRMKRKENFVLA